MCRMMANDPKPLLRSPKASSPRQQFDSCTNGVELRKPTPSRMSWAIVMTSKSLDCLTGINLSYDIASIVFWISICSRLEISFTLCKMTSFLTSSKNLHTDVSIHWDEQWAQVPRSWSIPSETFYCFPQGLLNVIEIDFFRHAIDQVAFRIKDALQEIRFLISLKKGMHNLNSSFSFVVKR